MKGLRFKTDQKDGYIKIDKETLAMYFVPEDEFRNIKKEYK